MSRIVVTGATSMMGLATIKAALSNGVEKVYAVVRPNSLNINRLPQDDRIIIVECELENYEILSSLIMEECELFFHFAWEASQKKEDEKYFDIEVSYRNVDYALKAYKTAVNLHCRNFIGAGSQAEYGNLRQDTQRPEHNTDPVTGYGVAKDTIRRFLMIKSKETDVKVQWCRIFSVYGPHDRKNTLISTLVDKLSKGERIEMTAGTQIWDYLYEDEAGKALYLIGKNAETSGIYCVGNGHPRMLREYVLEAKAVIQSTSEIVFGAIPYNASSVLSLNPDISKVKELTEWEPNLSFKDGLISILHTQQVGTLAE